MFGLEVIFLSWILILILDPWVLLSPEIPVAASQLYLGLSPTPKPCKVINLCSSSKLWHYGIFVFGENMGESVGLKQGHCLDKTLPFSA